LCISARATSAPYLLSLERHAPAHRMHQYYRLTVQPNLFGEWSLLREWERIGRPSQMQTDLYVSLGATQDAFRRKARESAGEVISNAEGAPFNRTLQPRVSLPSSLASQGVYFIHVPVLILRSME
jgi:predicted DNA-binding WGR domain protein